MDIVYTSSDKREPKGCILIDELEIFVGELYHYIPNANHFYELEDHIPTIKLEKKDDPNVWAKIAFLNLKGQEDIFDTWDDWELFMIENETNGFGGKLKVMFTFEPDRTNLEIYHKTETDYVERKYKCPYFNK